MIHTCVNTHTVHRGCSGHSQVSRELMMDHSYKQSCQLSLINSTYIMSANYPKYYLTGEDCSWRVRIPISGPIRVQYLPH